MTLFTVTLLAVCVAVSDKLFAAFLSNPYFNSGILVTLTFGVAAAYRQISRIDRSVLWIQGFKGSSGPARELRQCDLVSGVVN